MTHSPRCGDGQRRGVTAVCTAGPTTAPTAPSARMPVRRAAAVRPKVVRPLRSVTQTRAGTISATGLGIARV